jgi:hypothetical protein
MNSLFFKDTTMLSQGTSKGVMKKLPQGLWRRQGRKRLKW